MHDGTHDGTDDGTDDGIEPDAEPVARDAAQTPANPARTDSADADAAAAELARLRRRAYGPDADIHTDPVALARLQQLEDAAPATAARTVGAGTAESPPGGASSVVAPTSVAAQAPAAGRLAVAQPLMSSSDGSSGAPASDTGADAATATVPHEAPAAERRTTDPSGSAYVPASVAAADDAEGIASAGASAEARPGWRRVFGRRTVPLGVAIIGAVVVVVVTAVVSDAALRQRGAASLTGGASQVATLPSDPNFVVPEFFQPVARDAVRAYEPFLGLRAIVTPVQFLTPSTDRCIFILEESDVGSSNNGSYSGSWQQGCSAGSFPTVVSFTVTDESPDELIAQYPVGTAMQFVWDEDVDGVSVYVAPSASPDPEAADGEP